MLLPNSFFLKDIYILYIICFRDCLTVICKYWLCSDMSSLKQNIFKNQLCVGLYHFNWRTLSSWCAHHFLLPSGLCTPSSCDFWYRKWGQKAYLNCVNTIYFMNDILLVSREWSWANNFISLEYSFPKSNLEKFYIISRPFPMKKNVYDVLQKALPYILSLSCGSTGICSFNTWIY